MTITASIVISGDDPKFAAVMAALGGAALPASTTTAPSGGTTIAAPAFTESLNGSVISGLPSNVDGAQSGRFTDQFGTDWWMQWSAGDKYPVAVSGGHGVAQGSVMDLCNGMYYLYPPGASHGEVWVVNTVAGTCWVWRNDTRVSLPLPSPLPSGPLITPPAVPIGAPAPAPVGSVVPVATPAIATAKGMATAIAAAASGATVTLAAGVYTETAALSVPMTLTGAGESTTTINCQGIIPYFKKAVLVPSVAGCTIESLSITGAAIANSDGGNAAGVRDSGDGIGFALKTVEIYGCQMGVLTFASPITIDSAYIHDNGNATAGAGTHNIYIGAGPSFSLTNSIVQHCTHEHEVKSRAKATTIAGCTITTGGMGSCIDIPDGGMLAVSNTTLALDKAADPSQQDEVVIHYGEESANNLAAGVAISLTNVVIDTTALPGISAIIALGSFIPNATLALVNVTYKGDTAPSFQGFLPANITGTITKAAA